MIAFHFPPLIGSSGIQRTLRFVQHLPAVGWDPVVLTAHPRAYEATDDDMLSEVPEGVPVRRAFCLDAARHLSIGGRYPSFVALPDRWASWWLGALLLGMRLIREYRVCAIWSTYPVATAHLIGATLQRLTGLPWVADFRDPMAQSDYPESAARRRSFLRVERKVIDAAAACTFTTPGAMRLYADRYLEYPRSRLRLIENGYDEESFGAVDPSGGPLCDGALTLLHSGIVYPSERDPSHLFAALALLKRRRPDAARLLRVRFRAPGHAGLLINLAREHAVEDMIDVLPTLPYRSALVEMLRADGLLLMQAANCGSQVPAKYYEYLRAGRPILALTDEAGDTAQLMQRDGLQPAAPLDDAGAIASALEKFITQPGWRKQMVPQPAVVGGASRLARTRQLARLLSDVVKPGSLAATDAANGASRCR